MLSGERNRTAPPKEMLPRHIGIIMDGNGRWAKKRNLPREAGHSKGCRVFVDISRYCRELGIPYLTVFAFSTENWKRPEHEVRAIMKLLEDYLDDAANHPEEETRIRVIGNRHGLPPALQESVRHAEEISRDFRKLTVNLAVNYGGREEILHAVKQAVRAAADGTLSPDALDEHRFGKFLYAGSDPPMDFILRPSGEKRLSNFTLWQAAYAELIFMDVLWPDFTPEHLNAALWEYTERNRRFGGI